MFYWRTVAAFSKSRAPAEIGLNAQFRILKKFRVTTMALNDSLKLVNCSIYESITEKSLNSYNNSMQLEPQT